MRIEDLMINDWVFNTHNNKPEQVQEILTVSNCDDGNSVMLDYNDIYNEDDIEPILLTPEILEKNGYIFDAKETNKLKDIMPNTNMYKFPLGVGFYIEHNTIKNTYVLSDHGWIQMKYVHEFQHLLKLCGIDKQIVL